MIHRNEWKYNIENVTLSMFHTGEGEKERDRERETKSEAEEKYSKNDNKRC